MNVIEWLERYSGIEANIRSLTKTYDKLKFSAARDGQSIPAEFHRLADEISTETEKCVAVQYEILSAISRMKNNVSKTILREHFINRVPWEGVAELIGYSDKWTKNELLKKACKELIYFNPELGLTF